MIGDDKSVVKETKQGWRLEENMIGHTMTQIGATKLTGDSRSGKVGGGRLSDGNENGDPMTLGRN